MMSVETERFPFNTDLFRLQKSQEQFALSTQANCSRFFHYLVKNVNFTLVNGRFNIVP